MWPSALWEKLYEPAIRRSAGLGRLSREADPDSYEKAYVFCDLLVIGGGPAGLAAALTAGRAGARVILCEDDFLLGGRLSAERAEVDGLPGTEWARQSLEELRSLSNVRILARTAVFGVYDSGTYGALERVSDHLAAPAPHQPRQRLWKIVAKAAILATGTIERPIVFGGNDRPGVMLASAVRSYLNRFAVSPGQRAAVFTTTDDGWTTAADLLAAGIELVGVIDARPEVAPAVREKAGGARVLLGAQVTDAIGGHRLRRIAVRDAAGRVETLDLDLLAVSGGFNPNLGLATHLGGKGDWSEAHQAFLPGVLPPGMLAAGAVSGAWSLSKTLASGYAAGATAAETLGFAVVSAPSHDADEASAVSALWHVSGSRTKAFVDFQNDVTDKDIALAAREGFVSVEHLKRYTTLGMATDQGKLSNVNGLAIMAELTGKTIAQTGTTRMRPPAVPVAIGAFAGLHRDKQFKPTRLTPSHQWATGQGAVFVETGQWLRAQWYPQNGETDWLASVSREVNAVRTAVGICDVSTLGKIALQGPDVGAFLDRVYANTFSTLPVGKARYGLMLREDGFVMDDGTTARLSETSYVMSTTTINAAKVMQHLEFCHQVLWPEFDLAMVSITEQWAQFAIAGPNARKLLQRFYGAGTDFSNDAFPYLAAREIARDGLPTRLFRLSFSGELAYEIAVPARYGDSVVRALMAAGTEFGITPYGTEALGVMRIEKGHVAGNELNGQTVARDLGLGKMMSQKKDFVGRLMAQRPALVDPDRPQLAGFRPVDGQKRLRAGAHFIGVGVTASPETDEGYMTSVAFSPSLGHWIGLGLLRRGPERIGQRIRAFDPIRGEDVEVEIVSPVFVDPTGEKLHG